MLVQICPPGTGGVRDYAERLRHAWVARGIASELVDGRPSIAARLSAQWRADDGGLAVVVHFSGYGYAPRGLCQWLVDELRALRQRHAGALRLIVVFHELFASSPPWRSAFWLAPLQSSIARQLAGLADTLWTNTDHHAAWLRGVAGDSKPLHARPVFSNVGELVDLRSWETRQTRMIVFGAAVTRQRALARLRTRRSLLIALGITELVEAGDGVSQLDGELGMPTRHLGRVSTQALGALLGTSRFGLLDYPARYLGKSGVFAAYAAHGCVALNLSDRTGDADGLRAGIDYIDLSSAHAIERDELAPMSRRLNRWYAGHSLALQATELLRAVQGPGSTPAT